MANQMGGYIFQFCYSDLWVLTFFKASLVANHFVNRTVTVMINKIDTRQVTMASGRFIPVENTIKHEMRSIHNNNVNFNINYATTFKLGVSLSTCNKYSRPIPNPWSPTLWFTALSVGFKSIVLETIKGPERPFWVHVSTVWYTNSNIIMYSL